jgi:hypothetical protein
MFAIGSKFLDHPSYILYLILYDLFRTMWDLRFSRQWLWQMASSGMLRRVALVRADVSEEFRTSIIRVRRIGERWATLTVTSNRYVGRVLVTANVAPSSPILVTLMMGALSSCETSLLTRATRRNIPEDAIRHNHRREILKTYTRSSSFGNAVFFRIENHEWSPRNSEFQHMKRTVGKCKQNCDSRRSLLK